MAPPATANAIPSHCRALGRSRRKAVARTTVHSGYKAVRGIATLAFAPFSRQANTAQFPSPFTAPARSPTNITPALSPASGVTIQRNGSITSNPAVTQMTMERAETRFVPSFICRHRDCAVGSQRPAHEAGYKPGLGSFHGHLGHGRICSYASVSLDSNAAGRAQRRRDVCGTSCRSREWAGKLGSIRLPRKGRKGECCDSPDGLVSAVYSGPGNRFSAGTAQRPAVAGNRISGSRWRHAVVRARASGATPLRAIGVGIIGAGNVLWAYFQVLDRLVPRGWARIGPVCARRKEA